MPTNPTRQGERLTEIIDVQELRIEAAFNHQSKGLLKSFEAKLRKYPLELYKGTNQIKPTAANLKIANKIWREMAQSSWPAYLLKDWEKWDLTIRNLEKINAGWWSSLFDNYTTKPIYSDLTKEASAITRGVLSQGERMRVLDAPINNLLKTYVRSGGELDRMIDVLSRSLTGQQQRQTGPDQLIGQTFTDYRALNRTATDATYTYSRSYNALVGSNLGAKIYYYSGGTVRDTRAFCMTRHEKAWHEKEIEKWPSLKWEGRKRGTNKGNIFQFLGGYQCRHQLIPITKSMVDKKDLDRMKSKGLIK